MPTSKEIVDNRILSGTELSKIILKDVAALMENDGSFTHYAGYGRVSYEVRLTLHVDNFIDPVRTTSVASKKIPADRLEAEPQLAALEDAPPLKDASPRSYVSQVERHREIQSPNVARIENELPVMVTTRSQDGQTQEMEVNFDKDLLPEDSIIPPVDTDTSKAARYQWVKGENDAVCECGLNAKIGETPYCDTCGGFIDDWEDRR